jgi:hypothetical protein
MRTLLNLLKLLSNLYLFAMAFIFLGWYIKMHFHPKWFWAFWLNTIVAIVMYVHHNQPDPERERIDRMTGAEYWEMTH